MSIRGYNPNPTHLTMSDKKQHLRAKRAHLSTVIQDRAELERKLAELARATILNQALTAELNAEIETLKNRFAPKLAATAETISECSTAVENYALSHRTELFGKDSKTATIAGHELTLRDNGGAIVTARGVNAATVLDRLITHEDETTADLFLKWRPSLNKEAAKAKWPDHQSFLEDIGLRLEHTENFAINLALMQGADTQIKAA